MQTKPIRVGDVVVIRTSALGDCKVKVFNVEYEIDTARTRVDLDWGGGQTSKVYAHDEGSSWHRLSNFN